MGFRLGHRIVKVWKWMKRWRKSRPYTRLKDPNYTRATESLPVPIGRGKPCRKWAEFLQPHIWQRQRQTNCPVMRRKKHIPKGYSAVYVGRGEEHNRFVIPAMYFNHPLFGELLKEAEEEYGFQQKGAINLPCQVAHFENVRSQILHAQRQR